MRVCVPVSPSVPVSLSVPVSPSVPVSVPIAIGSPLEYLSTMSRFAQASLSLSFTLSCATAIAAVAGTVAVSGCGRHDASASHAFDSDEAAKLLIDRNWIDRMPENHRDRLHVFRFVPSMGGGVYQDRTLFKGTFELFVYKVQGDAINMTLPETHERVTTRFTIEPVTGPAPFDLKLTLFSVPRGPQVLYGIRAETDRTGTALEQRLHELKVAE